MKILFTPSDNNLAGAFQSMVRLCAILKNEYGCEVVVLLRKSGLGEKLLEENGIPSVKINSFNWVVPDKPTTNFRRVELLVRTLTKPFAQLYNRFAVGQIVRLIKKEKFDIVHLNTTYIYVSALAALKTGTKLVWHLREFLEEDQSKRIWNRKAGYKLISKADRVITISDSLHAKYKKLLPEANLVRIYNGLDEDYYACQERSILEGETVHLVMIGTINASKGQQQAIDAMKILVGRGYTNLRLCIVGEITRFARSLQEKVSELNLDQYISFAGQQKDTAPLYHQSDISLICSRFEAFGRVTVEAMMGGCLVIGANTGGTVELVENGSTGFLYSSGDAADLADKIEYAVVHREEARRIAHDGRKYMMENMTARRNAKNIYALYQELL